MNTKKGIVFLNGKFVSPQEAKASLLSPGFLSGWGAFETMRACNNNIVYLPQHLERLKKSALMLGLNMPYSSGEIKRLVTKTVRQCSDKDIYLRITLWNSGAGAELMILARQYRPPEAEKYKKGFSVCVSSLRQAENSFLSRIKSTNRILYELSYRQAKNNNFDEAIILNNRGDICEASRSNIFFINNNCLFTPALECGCLPGITRKAVFDIAKKHNIPVDEGKFTVSDLANSDAAFVTNSLIGVMPLTKIENQPINNCRLHPLIHFLMHRYTHLLTVIK